MDITIDAKEEGIVMQIPIEGRGDGSLGIHTVTLTPYEASDLASRLSLMAHLGLWEDLEE